VKNTFKKSALLPIFPYMIYLLAHLKRSWVKEVKQCKGSKGKN